MDRLICILGAPEVHKSSNVISYVYVFQTLTGKTTVKYLQFALKIF